MMKKMIALLGLLLCVVNVNAAKIKQIIFFGDSLTDNGNLYSLLLHILPKSPPYFEGRFSNGRTWAENLGKYYYDKSYVDYKIYAYGGATAVFHMPSTKFIAPTLLEIEVDKYLADALFTDKSDILYTIWIGGNDYIFDQDHDPESTTENVVNKITWAISKLQSYGAKYFLILNLPNLTKTPYIQTNGSIEKVDVLNKLHNQKLDAAVKTLQANNPDLKFYLINTYDLFNDLIQNPGKYNDTFHTNITDTTNACWGGSYWLSYTSTKPSMAREIQQTLAARHEKSLSESDANNISEFISHSPALSYTYTMGNSYAMGNVPCANPNEHIFWDAIHPTETVHQLLAKYIEIILEGEIV